LKPKYWTQAQLFLSKNDPVMAKLIKAYKGEVIVSRGNSFETLLRSIVGQQISVKAAQTVWQRLIDQIKKAHPDTILAEPLEKLRACGLSQRKAEYAKDLATHFTSGQLDPAKWLDMEDEEIIELLCEVRGIGRWTAEMFLMFHLLRPNILPVDDVGLQKAASIQYKKKYPMSAKTLTALGKKWDPWRSVATWYLWRSLDPIPVEY